VFTFEYGNRQALCGSAVCAAVGEVSATCRRRLAGM
jgi:hypothetical protein